MKGYSAMHVVKAVTEKVKKFDSKAFADAMHTARISVKDYPGVLLDVAFDKNGDLDRESFLVKVVDGKQVVTEVLRWPAPSSSSGLPRGARPRWAICCNSSFQARPPAAFTRCCANFTPLWQAAGIDQFRAASS